MLKTIKLNPRILDKWPVALPGFASPVSGAMT